VTVKAVVFDLGGVLVRTEDGGPREQAARRLGLTRVELEHLVFSGPSGLAAQRGEIQAEEHWENILRELGLPAGALAGLQSGFWGGDRVDYTLVEAIRSLRGTYRTVLLSNAFSDLRHMLTDQWQIAGAFDEIFISSELGVTKPDLQIYRLLLNRLGLEPQEAVFVDDYHENIAGARKAGLHTVHFKNPAQAWEELEHILEQSGVYPQS